MTHLNQDEELIVGVSAKRKVDSKKVEGRLTITSQRILFHPDDNARAQDTLTIELADITEIKAARAFKLIPQGVSISVRPDHKYHFLTDKYERLLKALRGQITTRLFYIPEEVDDSDE